MFIKALLTDGTTLEGDYSSITELPVERIQQVFVRRESFPPVTVVVDTAAGERVHFFTRNSLSIGDPDSGPTAVPVYEIQKDGALVVRLYWHPQMGPILATKDLYF